MNGYDLSLLVLSRVSKRRNDVTPRVLVSHVAVEHRSVVTVVSLLEN
jgi:hypothetical protein